jgi:hypothetical protein
VLIDEEDYLAHYGILRRSGRYPWNSGKDENTRNRIFLDTINELKAKGLSEKEIAQGFDCSIRELRSGKEEALAQQKQSKIAMAQRLKDKGYSNVAIGEHMGVNESTVRSLLAPGAKDKADVLNSTAKMLKNEVDEKGMIDVGSGVENYIGVSSTRLNTAVSMLREQGYELHQVRTLQVATGQYTNRKVLCTPGTPQKEVFENQDKIQLVSSFSETGGRNFAKVHPPMILNPNRVEILYAKDGGSEADGMIYLRPGKDDLSLGGKNYAQVRVAVGQKHYIKGMATYKNDLPDGVDVLFCVDKNDTGNKFDAMKPSADDPMHPFGSVVRQVLDDPGGPNERVKSVMNIVNEEGQWEKWSKNLSTQMLSKQNPALAKSQLDMTFDQRQQEFKEISALTNNTLKKRLLNDFADATDSASVHMKAAALPQQSVKVLLPIPSMKPTEVYAPTYNPGERVVLIRHPHGGTFEIPELIVNNRNPDARRLIGLGRDAIGINHEVAKRLSGADFDGDTVLVIPDPQKRITVTRALDELKNFDPRSAYPEIPNMKRMTNTQIEMGKISNLITDMSIRQAPRAEIARAIKHSMVVIDAEKHGLNYKQSYNDNNIKDLVIKYQSGGASTLISRAKSRQYVPERKQRTVPKGGPIDLATGRRAFEPVIDRRTGLPRINPRTGKPRQTKTTKLAEAEDARTLMSTPSGTPMERLYANHSNKLKAMANKARLDSVKTPSSVYNSSANKAYKEQVDSLNAKLTVALRNRPLERQAQQIANATIRQRVQANPNITKEQKKKIRFQALEEARVRTGARKNMIEITPDEWNAIQAGAISSSKLNEILNHSKMDVVRKLATPRSQLLMTSSKTNRARQMLVQGYTREEVADILGVSLTTLDTAVRG